MIRILGISGSLRKNSFNTALLRAAAKLAPEGVELSVYEGLRDIPPYDDDVRDAGYPAEVQALREQVKAADGLLFATPEYNRSFSGVLKNAIDWVSRPPEPPFAGKVAAVIGASPGALGTGLANYQLRQVLSIVGVHVVPGGEMLVGGAASKFDADGSLTDEATGKYLVSTLEKLVSLSKALHPK